MKAFQRRRAALSTIVSAGIAMAPALPLGGCGMMSFDKYDGRWVANVPPAGDCCPTRLVMDVDGHKFTGSTEDCHGVTPLQGHVDDQGDATLHVNGAATQVKFTGVNFSTVLPNDRCRRPISGNRGG